MGRLRPGVAVLALVAVSACGRPLVCPTWPDGSEIAVVRVFEHYNVVGADFDDYRRNRKLPFKCKTDEAIACHEGRFCSYYQTVIEDGACRVAGVHLTLLSRITLPRWANPVTTGADAEDYALSKAKVLEHEDTHFKIARKYLDEMHRRLWSVPPQTSCEALSKLLHAAMDDVEAAEEKEQSAFDAADKKITFEDYKKAHPPAWRKK